MFAATDLGLDSCGVELDRTGRVVKMTTWKVQETMSLIEDLHQLPILWDASLKEYKDRNKKCDVYTELGKKYKTAPAEVEKKIQSLKTQFRREHAKLIKVKASGASPKKASWFGYEALLFLLQGGAISRGSRCTDKPVDGERTENPADENEDNSVDDGTQDAGVSQTENGDDGNTLEGQEVCKYTMALNVRT